MYISHLIVSSMINAYDVIMTRFSGMTWKIIIFYQIFLTTCLHEGTIIPVKKLLTRYDKYLIKYFYDNDRWMSYACYMIILFGFTGINLFSAELDKI